MLLDIFSASLIIYTYFHPFPYSIQLGLFLYIFTVTALIFTFTSYLCCIFFVQKTWMFRQIIPPCRQIGSLTLCLPTIASNTASSLLAMTSFPLMFICSPWQVNKCLWNSILTSDTLSKFLAILLSSLVNALSSSFTHEEPPKSNLGEEHSLIWH